jgi:hypothetical protein
MALNRTVALAKVIEIHGSNLELTELTLIFFFLDGICWKGEVMIYIGDIWTMRTGNTVSKIVLIKELSRSGSPARPHGKAIYLISYFHFIGAAKVESRVL